MTTTTIPATITEPGVYNDIPEDRYHADPVPGGSLSSTGARKLLDSPARFHWDQTHRTDTVAFDVGRAVHTKVLGAGAPIVTYPPEHLTASGRASTKAATIAWEAEQRAAGLTVIAPADMRRVDAMAEAVLAHPGARQLLERDGNPEASAFAVDPETGVWTRARFDYLNDTVAVDLKTTAGSASPTGFGASAAKYGYPVQEAHYADTLEWATGRRAPMTFIVVEKTAPHLVAVHEFDDVTRLAGRELAARARHIYAECKATNTWPGYGDDTHTTVMPGWWFDQADDTDEMELT